MKVEKSRIYTQVGHKLNLTINLGIHLWLTQSPLSLYQNLWTSISFRFGRIKASLESVRRLMFPVKTEDCIYSLHSHHLLPTQPAPTVDTPYMQGWWYLRGGEHVPPPPKGVRSTPSSSPKKQEHLLNGIIPTHPAALAGVACQKPHVLTHSSASQSPAVGWKHTAWNTASLWPLQYGNGSKTRHFRLRAVCGTWHDAVKNRGRKDSCMLCSLCSRFLSTSDQVQFSCIKEVEHVCNHTSTYIPFMWEP